MLVIWKILKTKFPPERKLSFCVGEVSKKSKVTEDIWLYENSKRLHQVAKIFGLENQSLSSCLLKF